MSFRKYRKDENGNLVEIRHRVQLVNFGPSLAVQADKDRTDIRNIVKMAMRGKSVTVNYREGRFLDIADAPTYIEALNFVAEANLMFDRLPAALRDRFNNDPAAMLSFIDNPENKEEAIKLGLLPKPPAPPVEPPPMKVEVVNPVVSGSGS